MPLRPIDAELDQLNNHIDVLICFSKGRILGLVLEDRWRGVDAQAIFRCEHAVGLRMENETVFRADLIRLCSTGFSVAFSMEFE